MTGKARLQTCSDCQIIAHDAAADATYLVSFLYGTAFAIAQAIIQQYDGCLNCLSSVVSQKLPSFDLSFMSLGLEIY